jgi:hypothetical protein
VLNPWRLEPVDLRRFIRLGVEHIYAGAVNPRRGYLPFVRFNLTEPPAWARHEYWGSPHMVGRFLDALALADGVADVEHDEAAIEGLRSLLHDSLDNPYGLPFDTLPNDQGQVTGNMHHCREVLLALVALATWRGCDRSMTLAHDLVRAMEKATQASGEYPSHLLGEDGWLEAEPGWINYTTGRAILALTTYYRASRDEMAVDLAKRLADDNIEKTFTADGALKQAAGRHLHSTTGTMAALLDLGVLTGEARYLEIGRRLYDGELKRWRTSWGWAKESRSDSAGRGEANNTGDYIEAALTLAQAGHRDYFDDAECFIRNGLLASQVVNTDWIVQSEEHDTEDYAYSDIRERARGAFAFTTPNGYHSYNTDLMGGAIRALCKACVASVTEDDDSCRINLLFSGSYPRLAIHSDLPRENHVRLRIREDIALRIRLPRTQPDDTTGPQNTVLLVNNKPRPPAWEGPELVVGHVRSGDTITVSFVMPRRHVQEMARGWEPVFDVEWQGSTVTALAPSQGPIPLYPVHPPQPTA